MASLVPLALSWHESLRYRSWPVTQGIPFADGVLERGKPVRVVDSDGRAYPTQSSCLATWREDLRFVKWLLVDFQTDAPVEAGRKLFLSYGDSELPPEPAEPVRIRRDADVLELSTGRLRLELIGTRHPWQAPARPQPFGRLLLKEDDGGWREIWGGDSAPELVMRDAHGLEYRSASPGPSPRVTVEEEGPLRSSVCIRGYQCSLGGVRFCPYILRLHVFAGSTDIRMHHTFVFDQEPHAVRLASIGMELPLGLGLRQRAAVAGGEGPTGACFATRFESLESFQADDRRYEVRRDGELVASSTRSSGWASLSGSLGSCVAVLKDSWREYPKGFTVKPSRLGVDIWPSRADPLEFTTPFEEPAIYFRGTRDEETFRRLVGERPTAPLNMKSLDVQSPKDLQWVERMLEKWAPGRVATHNDTGTDNGTGAAKTTEILLRFSTVAIGDAEAEELASAVQEPVIAPADPAWSCATRAFGHFHAAGDPRFAEVDRGLDFFLESVALEPQERCRLYGMMRSGNMVCSHSAGPAVAYTAHKDREPEKALRHVGPYNNETNDQILAVWGNFLRTGSRRDLAVAARYSRAVADVSIIHAHPTHPERVGLMHYHNCHQWSGGPSPSHTLIAGILTDYYVTGNRRLLEVALEVADWVVRTQEPAGIVSNRSGALHREYLCPVWNLVEAWQATWERRYGDLARRSLAWFLRVIEAVPGGKLGTYPVSVYTRGLQGDEAWVEPVSDPSGHARDVYRLYEAALRLFPSETLKRHVIAEADFFVEDFLTDNFITGEMARRLLTSRSKVWRVDERFYWTQWGASGNSGAAIAVLAWELTGDYRYAAYAHDHLFGSFRRQFERCRRFADWRFTWIGFGSYIPGLVWTVASALDRGAAELDRAEREWKSRRLERGSPVYEGRGVDFDRDEMDANGNITSRPPDDIPRERPARPAGAAVSIGVIPTADPP